MRADIEKGTAPGWTEITDKEEMANQSTPPAEDRGAKRPHQVWNCRLVNPATFMELIPLRESRA